MKYSEYIEYKEFINDSSSNKFDIIILDMHGYYDENILFNDNLNLSNLVFSALTDKYSLLTIKKFLSLEHDFGMWKLSNKIAEELATSSSLGNILVGHVLLSRGVLDINKESSSYGNGVRPILEENKHSHLIEELKKIHISTKSNIENLLKKLKPNGFLFLPHSMNKYQPNKIQSISNINKYIQCWTQKTLGIRNNTLLSKTEDNMGIGNENAYIEMEKKFYKYGELVVWNRFYRTNPSYYDYELMTTYPNSAFLEIRKDNLSESMELDMDASLYRLDSTKVELYSKIITTAIKSHVLL